MPATTVDLVEEVCHQFNRDGIEVRVLSVDESAATVDLDLDLSNVECLDCVMPGDYMKRLIAGSLADRVGHEVRVNLLDARVAPEPAPVASESNGNRSLVTIFDPTAVGRGAGNLDPGPDAGSLRGKTVGLRVDTLWQSWDWVSDEWSRLFAAAGADVRSWRRAQGIHGEEGETLQADYEEFLGSVDVLISGLGNCGSCTAWTIKDAIVGLGTGLPSMAVVTEQFEPLALTLAQDAGRTGLRRHVLPYPLDTRPEEEVREIARNSFGSMLKTLGAEA